MTPLQQQTHCVAPYSTKEHTVQPQPRISLCGPLLGFFSSTEMIQRSFLKLANIIIILIGLLNFPISWRCPKVTSVFLINSGKKAPWLKATSHILQVLLYSKETGSSFLFPPLHTPWHRTITTALDYHHEPFAS